ncbi:MAG: diguanylate cyclase, partial [Thiovulaceae bacterium]|nr:diguanylate cyclase [Sulfurimonadaceae bacterium]
MSTAFATGLIIIILLIVFQFFKEKSSTVKEAEVFAKILADNIAPSIVNNNFLAISNTLLSVEHNYKIRQTFALDLNWKILGAFHQGHDFYKKREIVSVIRENENLWKDGFYYCVVSIHYEEDKIGYLVVVASLDDFYFDVFRSSLVVIFIIIIAFLMTYRLRKTLQESILLPISQLDTITTNIVRTKVLDQKIPRFNDDEIGDLAKNFDAMLTEIYHYQNELNAQKNILEYQANHDLLTKLPNRVLFNDRLHQAIRHGSRNNEQFALLFIDLDKFKEVNDTFGHEFGDTLLQKVAKVLRALIREEDTLSRLGGDEFTIILQNIKDPLLVSTVAKKILNALQKPFLIHDQKIEIGCSIGISLYPEDSNNITELLKHADIAMYRSKEEGRNRYHFYTQQMTEKIVLRANLEKRMRFALEKKDFIVYYQPQFNAHTDTIIGMEALVRWPNSDGSVALPMQFLPLAEELGLLSSISNEVLHMVMLQAVRWNEESLLVKKISVNITMSQIEDSGFIDLVKSMLLETTCNAKWICLEITEGQMMRDPNKTQRTLEALNALGFEISIDDFGTGHSSLAYLKRFPVHELKIDQS